MNVLYSDIEQEIVNKLQPLVTAGIDVVPLPQVEAEFQRPFQNGRVTVVYKGSTFDDHLNTHHVVQDERLQFEIVVVCRRLRGETGVHGIVEVIKRTLLGFAPTDCSKMKVIKNSYQEYQKEAALWGYSIIFETVYRLVEDAEYDTEQAITEITVDYSTGDSYDITEPPSPLPYVRLSNTNATWIQDAPNGLPFQVPNSPVQVTDENGNQLGSGSVPSVEGGVVQVNLPPCPPTPIDVTINGTIVADDAVSDVALTLVDQNGDQLPFTQTGTELEVEVGGSGLFDLEINVDGVLKQTIQLDSQENNVINVNLYS